MKTMKKYLCLLYIFVCVIALTSCKNLSTDESQNNQENQALEYEDKITELSENITKLLTEIEELERDNSELKENVSKKINEIDQLKKEKSDLERRLQNEEDIQNLESQIKSLEKEIDEKELSLKSLGAELTNAKSELGNYKKELENYESQISMLNNENISYKLQLDDCNSAINDLNSRIEELEEENSILAKKFKITFVYNNGLSDQIINYTVFDFINKPDDPVRNEYTFLGWYIDNICVDFESYYVYKDVVLEAKWKFNPNVSSYNYGIYPQTCISSDKVGLYTALNLLIDELPNENNSNGWISCGNWNENTYGISDAKKPYRWYLDVEYNGDKYRAVYFTKYEGYFNDSFELSSTGLSNVTQFAKNNKYYTNTIYWFKYEPIVWDIFDIDNNKILVSQKILDCKPFSDTMSANVINDQVHNISEFENSTLFSYLNTDFKNCAFTLSQKRTIKNSYIKNGFSTSYDSRVDYPTGGIEISDNDTYYVDRNTPNVSYYSFYGYIYILSFEEYHLIGEDKKEKIATDYAKCMGLMSSNWYWLRSPKTATTLNVAGRAKYDVYSGSNRFSYYINAEAEAWRIEYGIVPVIQLGD